MVSPFIRSNRNQRPSRGDGFSAIEVLVAVSILAIIAVSVVSVIAYAQDVRSEARDRPKAVMLAEEGMEAARYLKERDFSVLEDGIYGLVYESGSWSLTDNAEPIDDLFSRSLEISTIDPATKRVDITVGWTDGYGPAHEVFLTALLTDWREPGGEKWSTPVLVSSVDLPGNQNGLKVEVRGEKVYVIQDGGDGEFVIIDRTDYEDLVLEGYITLPGNPRDISVDGGYAYVASTDKDAEFQVVSIADPLAPMIVDSHDASRNQFGYSVWAGDGRAFLGRQEGKAQEFWGYSLSDPENVLVEGISDLSGSANDMILIDEYVYVASDERLNELIVVDVGDPGSPSVVGGYDLPGNERAISIDSYDEYILLGTTAGEVFILDVTAPTLPSLAGQFTVGDDVRDIEVDDANSMVFVGSDSNSSEIQIFDISDISIPEFVGQYDALGDINGLAYDSESERLIAVGDSNGQDLIILAPE